ncbi:MAG: HAD family hydrolase [Candidatus Hodarchaeota archaeon]
MDLRKYKALIFDLFHTLTSVESARAPGKGTSAILRVSRKDWNAQLLKYSYDRLRGKIKDPYKIIKKMAHAINSNISEEIIKEATDTRMFRFKYSLRHIDPSVLDTLAKLKDMGKLIGLISNGDVHEVAGWDESPLSKYFNSVIFSCNVG